MVIRLKVAEVALVRFLLGGGGKEFDHCKRSVTT